MHRKYTGGYKFTKLQELINPLIDDIKLFAKNEKIGDPDTNNKNILTGCRNRIWLRKMCQAHDEK